MHNMRRNRDDTLSKYDPLQRYLKQGQTEETPMTFAEVERVLGFSLPDSAKARSWWSNNPGSHVGVPAWRDAGFRVSRVDVGNGKVVFVREATKPAIQSSSNDTLTLRLDDLSFAARKLLNDYAVESSGDKGAAVRRALHEAAIARRGRLIDAIPLTGVKSDIDSVDLIREDRDAR